MEDILVQHNVSVKVLVTTYTFVALTSFLISFATKQPNTDCMFKSYTLTAASHVWTSEGIMALRGQQTPSVATHEKLNSLVTRKLSASLLDQLNKVNSLTSFLTASVVKETSPS